jgi:hypothetical protein
VPKRKPRKPQTPRARTNVRTTVPDEQILGKRRAPVWEKALAFVLAGHSLREASLEYGLPYSTLTTVAGEDRWCEQRGKVDEEVRKRLTEEIVQRRLCAAKAVEFVGDEIAAEHENLIRMVQAEFRIALTELSELRLAGKLATKKGMMGQFRALSGALRGASETMEKLASASAKTHETRRKVHRLDDDGSGMGESPLQAILRRMRESGKIAAPVAVETGAGHGAAAGDVGGGGPRAGA